MLIMDANEVYFYIVLYSLCTLEGRVEAIVTYISQGLVKHVTTCDGGGREGIPKVHKKRDVIIEWSVSSVI